MNNSMCFVSALAAKKQSQIQLPSIAINSSQVSGNICFLTLWDDLVLFLDIIVLFYIRFNTYAVLNAFKKKVGYTFWINQ